MSEARERIVWNVLASHRIYRGDIAREILAALDLPRKVNDASFKQECAFGRMNYARDRWQACGANPLDPYALSWENVWREALQKQRYYFQRRAMLLQIDEAKL